MNHKILFSSCIILLMLGACHKDNDNHSFGWTQDKTIFYYDKYSRTGTITDYLTLQVRENRFFQNSAAVNTYMRLYDETFAVKKDGLYGYSCVKCGVANEWFDCNDKFTYLLAPVNAYANQQIPIYGCDKAVYKGSEIVNPDTIITVPKGTYHTYVLQHDNGDKSYWNADSGIIRYEKTDTSGVSDGIEVFVLTKTE